MTELKTKFLNCPLCSGESIKVIQGNCQSYISWHEGLPSTLLWMKCSNCGHIHTEDYWTQAGLEQVFKYTHEGQLVGGNPDEKRKIWKPVIQNVLTVIGGFIALQKIIPKSTWIDIGCGDGGLVMTAAEFGFNAVGLDLRLQTTQALTSSGYQAVCGDFMQMDITGEPPMVISMMDVLEHMPNPCEVLQRAHALLHTKGVLVISLPNSECSSWKAMGNANPYWIEIEHYHNFSRQRLTDLLDQYGFDVVHYDIPFRYISQMELYAVKKQ
jgi:protein O-GlcNAc transferase